MDNEYVSRSRLFREAFLPGAYTRMRNQAYARVVGVHSSGAALDGVDKEQLREAVLNYLNDWETAGGTVDAGFKLAAQRKNLEIQSPSEIFVTPAPLMLLCKICKVMDFYDPRVSEDQALQKMESRIRERKGRKYIACKRPECKGSMIQIPYLAVHRCGHGGPIYVHHSARRATNIGYRDNGSFFQSSFFDVDTQEKLAGSLQDDCPACKNNYPQEVNKRGTPLTNGESFYAQSTQYIALSEQRGRMIAQLLGHIKDANGAILGTAADIAEGLASALLRQISSRELEQKLTSIFSQGSGDEVGQERLRLRLEKKRGSIRKFEAIQDLDEDLQEMLDSTRKEVAALEVQLAGSSGGFKAVRELIPDDETLSALIRHRRSMEAVFLTHDVSGVTVENAISQSVDVVQKEALHQQWEVVKSRYGIESISHIPDLLVVLATLGYTREKSIPVINPGTPPVNLNAFADRFDESMRGKIPVYAMNARTEALWIRLDPRRVLQWCVKAAGWEGVPTGILDCRAKSHAYLLQRSPAMSLNPGMVARETANDPQKGSAPFHLLHTISHSLILTARRHTGYDSKSIQEYLLPMDLSVILYVSSVQNYTAGGLLTLFQHYLQSWFDDASMFAFNCAFDPVCTDSGGACSGCVQTEIGCETFNHGLSRAYIHGGAIDRDATLTISQGFWDGAC